MTMVKVLFNKYGNYTCYKGNSIDIVLGDYDEAILWIEYQLNKGNTLSKHSYIEKYHIETYHLKLAKYIVRNM
jgi:hypothetical protein